MATLRSTLNNSSSSSWHSSTDLSPSSHIANSTSSHSIQCPSRSLLISLQSLPDDAISEMHLIYNPGEYILVNFIIPFILIFGVLSNSVFLLTVVGNPGMRTITAFYLINLTLCDLCFLICVAIHVYMTHGRSMYVYSDTLTSDTGCGVLSIFLYTCYFASFGFITLVGFERYKSMMRPLNNARLSGSKRCRTLKCVIGTWIVAIIIGVSLGLGLSRELLKFCVIWPDRQLYRDLPNILRLCTTSSSQMFEFALLLQLSVFTTFLVINARIYAQIIHRLFTQNQIYPLVRAAAPANVAGGGNANVQLAAEGLQNVRRPGIIQIPVVQNDNYRALNSISKMLVTNGVVFFLFLIPWYLNMLQLTIAEITGVKIIPANRQKTVIFIGTLFNSLNSPMNALIYCLTSPRYRRAMWRTMTLCCRQD